MEKKMRALQEARYQEELKRNKVRMAENRIKWQNDLDMQRAMREQEKKQQIEEDNIFFKMTMDKDARAEQERAQRHKEKMDRYLGDYDNQKGVIVSILILIDCYLEDGSP